MILRYLRVSELMKYDKNSLRTSNAMTVSSFYSEVLTGIKTNPQKGTMRRKFDIYSEFL